MKSLSWYYSTWFIAMLFAFWFLIIPIIIGCILVSKKERLIKQWEIDKIQEFEHMKNELALKETELMESVKQFEEEKMVERKNLELQKRNEEKIIQEKMRLRKIELENEFNASKKEAINIQLRYEREKKDYLKQLERRSKRKLHQIKRLKRLQNFFIREIIVLKDELLYQSFGFYDYIYGLEDSQEYKKMLGLVQQKQKEAVKNEIATIHNDNWQLNNSYRKGSAMNKKNIKMVIRSFNNECDAVISKVKFNNVEASEKKIRKAREQLNKLNEYNEIEITKYYLDLKLEELYLVYEHAKKKQEEKEEQRRINEQMREEQRVQEEIEKKFKAIKKDEQQYLAALEKYKKQLENAEQNRRYELEREIANIQELLKNLLEEKAELDYRVHNAKAGYVYVISNLGSFGENIYKIGMTRRLEPMDRVKELGDASVPFAFDVHMMIFSEDAPSLENALHRTFHNYRVNKVNNRKEFFRVSLEEIEKALRENHKAVFEFTKLAKAQEYRETMMIEKEQSKEVS